jgi:hypothetical protein
VNDEGEEYCDGPLLHNERLSTDVVSTVTNAYTVTATTICTDMRFSGNQPRIMHFGRVKIGDHYSVRSRLP